MRAYIRPLRQEVEIIKLPYKDCTNLEKHPDTFTVEVAGGVIIKLPRYEDFITIFESGAEQVKAEKELDDYYRDCSRYKLLYIKYQAEYKMTESEFMKAMPFEKYKIWRRGDE